MSFENSRKFIIQDIVTMGNSMAVPVMNWIGTRINNFSKGN